MFRGCVICVSRADAALLIAFGSWILPRCALGGLAWNRVRSAFPWEVKMKDLFTCVLGSAGGAALLALVSNDGEVEKRNDAQVDMHSEAFLLFERPLEGYTTPRLNNRAAQACI